MKSSILLFISKFVTRAASVPSMPYAGSFHPTFILTRLLETLSSHSSPVQSPKLHQKFEMFLPTILSSHFSLFISTDSHFPSLSWNLKFFNEDNTAAYYSFSRHSNLAIELIGLLFLIVSQYSFIHLFNSIHWAPPGGQTLCLPRGLPKNVSTQP